MKKTLISIFTAFCFVVSISYAYSQAYLFDVQTLNPEQGLPHHSTQNIIQDHNGYIWISGQGNISRYDGSEWKTYNYSKLNIFQERIATLAIDKQNRLWYAEPTPDGYSAAIDINTDSIVSLQTLSKGLLHSDSVIYVSNSRRKEGQILIGTKTGKIYTYKDNFELIYAPKIPFLDDIRIVAKEGFDEDYFISVYEVKEKKTHLLNVKNKRIRKQYHVPNETYYLLNDVLPEGIIELYTDFKKWRTYYQIQNDSLIPYRMIPEDEGYYKILHLHEDYICYYTDAQKIIVRDSKGDLMFEKQVALGYPQIRATVFQDKQNILWLTTSNGVLKVFPQKNNFEIINKSTKYKGNSIRGIYQDDDYFWWSGYNENLRKNLQTGKIEEYAPTKGKLGVVINFLKDDKGRFWLGNEHKHYFEYLSEKHDFVRYEIPDFSALLFQNHITKNHWIGTSNGWYIGELGSKISYVPLPKGLKNVHIRKFYQNGEGIWIGTGNGLFLVDGQTEKLIKHYTTDDGLSSNNINYIHQDAEGIYWIGTKDAGLMRWDKKNNKFKRFTEDDYLVDNNIYCIYEDELNRLWLPSDEGLMCFDKTTYDIRVFLEEDGVAHKEFNTYAHFQANDGTLIFGGIEGITKFHPKNIKTNDDYKIPLHINQVRILNEDDNEFRDETEAYLSTKEINFKPQDKILELQPGLLDYKSTGSKQYAYRLNDQQWTYTNGNTIPIMNPSFGQYTLSIKGKTASGKWSEVLKVPFYAKAPFYRQIWFFVTAGLLAAVLVFLFFRGRVRRLEKDRTRLEEEVKRRTAQIERDKATIEKQAAELRQLDQTKSRFFSNITHEFRTPLTLVTGPIEKMLSENPPKNMHQPLRGVLKNARSLLGLINQLLDISKLESSQMQVEISHGDIVEYTQNLIQQFQPLADVKQIKLSFNTEKPIWETYFDKGKWTKIVSNLISNAIKFTRDNGNIYIYLKNIQINKKDAIQLIVKDDGQGISPEYLPKIFDRFYRSSDHSHTIGGTGIGLALVKELIDLQDGKISVQSTLNQGSTFTVMLPVNSTATPIIDRIDANQQSPIPIFDVQEQDDIAGEAAPHNDNKLELLIIEDNAEMRSFIRSCIDQNTYNITEAADGEEGIRKALDIIPDLIISDVMMPKIDGFGVVQAIRSNLPTSHIPLILLTAKASLESRMEGFGHGADAFMSKPFSPAELTLRVRKLIEIRMMLQSRYQNNFAPGVLQGFQKEDEFINKLKTYITENITEPNLTSEVIGNQFRMSRMQLHRKLKALIQCTPADYVRSIRLETALQLLQQKEFNVSEIAYETGFSSPAHFSRAFKKVYGKPPSEVSKS